MLSFKDIILYHNDYYHIDYNCIIIIIYNNIIIYNIIILYIIIV